MSTTKRIALTLGTVLGALLLAPLAVADEIVVRDLNTGAEKSIRCWGITSETWTEVKYRERQRSADKSVPTNTVVRIIRGDKSANAQNLRSALGELERGNYAEAARALKEISGGGWKVDFDTGERTGFKSFAEGDPSGRNKRPSWVSEYAHFHYAKAKLMEGLANDDRAALEEALLAVDDVKVPGGDGKQTTGGFLGRFKGGNSRFYPEAMWIKAKALVGLGRYADAAQTFSELQAEATKIKLLPRWTYEGVIGPGVIAEAQGNLTEAVNGYRAAMPTMEVLLEQETRDWMRRQCGRWWSQAHMNVARVKLADAEKAKSPAKFSSLRTWIQKGSPTEVRKYAERKGWPKPSVDALVAGARDPGVQAVGLNGIGLAYLNEPKPRYEEAMLSFKAVSVKYFQVREQHARALYYLAKAAKEAAGAANGKAEVKEMYTNMADEAVRMLRKQHPDSDWANK